MSKELYKLMPWARKITGREEYEESAAERTARRKRLGLGLRESSAGGNVTRVGGNEYAEGDKKLDKILDANRKNQPRMADIRGGGGLDPYRAPTEPPTEDATEPLTEDATVSTIRNPSNPPRNAAEFGDFMKTLTADYGIKFPGMQERNGYESIHLPGTDNSGEYSAGDAAVMGTNPQQAIDNKRTNGSTEIVIGGNMGAQSGTSSAPDQGDQSRVVKGVNGTVFGGESEAPPTLSKDARRRAFLDYDGPGGSMMALRAAEAAQGTIKQNGVLYAVDDAGKGTAIDEDTAREFKKDGNKMASQDFLRNYRYPSDTQSSDSQQPEMPSDTPVQYRTPNTNFGPTIDDNDNYGKLLDASKGMQGIGPYADTDRYGSILRGYQ